MNSRGLAKVLALPLHFLEENKSITFDIYIRAGGKSVLYCRANDPRVDERVKRLKSKKGLEYFFVLDEQYSAFIDYLGGNLEGVFQDSERSLKEQVRDIYFQQRGLLIVLSADPQSKEYYSILRSTCSAYYKFFSENVGALEHLYQCSFEARDFDFWLDHSLRVAALSSRLIADSEADEAGKPIQEIVMGAFLHDIGYVTEEWEIRKPMDRKNPLYKGHPLGGTKVMDHSHVSPWVSAVILKHEEHIDGSGFPAGLRESDFDPAIQCVAAADAFDRLYTLQGMSFDEALKKLLIDKMGAYPLPLLQRLQSVIKQIS